ncbi:hypothetical protein ACGRHY_00505 [Streptomyces sp. HK10]|uniref:hypothetical protein n=1 Tax=Streptomyces sp. HK10 TaxID=3373255 RepID=UPI0037485593
MTHANLVEGPGIGDRAVIGEVAAAGRPPLGAELLDGDAGEVLVHEPLFRGEARVCAPRPPSPWAAGRPVAGGDR